jgi:preprotein translocase subunit SecF
VEFEKVFDQIYADYDRYLVVPAVLLLLAFGALGLSALDGEILPKGLDFTGGTEVTYAVDGEFSAREVESAFRSAGRADAEAIRQVSENGTLLSVRVPPPEINQSEAERIMEQAGYSVTTQSFRAISASVSGEFFLQAQIAFALAFTIMSLVIFVAFKDVVPSLAVIFAAAADVIFAAAGMTVLGIPLTLGSLAALLMLIGYSVDTDIVLSTRVLKRERGSLKQRIWSSVKTGVTMSSGGIAGFTLLYLVSTAIVGQSELSNVAAVMVIGLLADMPFTWFGNAIVLKKHVSGELEEIVPWL